MLTVSAEVQRMHADQTLMQVLIQQLNKDLSTELITLPVDQKDVLPFIIHSVSSVLKDPVIDLQAVLYRVDVPEHWARKCTTSEQLSEAIVLRCAQKVITRSRYSQPGGR